MPHTHTHTHTHTNTHTHSGNSSDSVEQQLMVAARCLVSKHSRFLYLVQVNSVQFSNHTGYPGGFTGDRLTGEQLATLVKHLPHRRCLRCTLSTHARAARTLCALDACH